MLTSAVMALTLVSLALGQGPEVVSDPAPSAATVEIIQPIIPDMSSESPPETHAPELPLPVEPRIWMRAEYLLWYSKKGPIPSLLTTGLTADKIPGALEGPNTTVLYGGTVDYLEPQRRPLFPGQHSGRCRQIRPGGRLSVFGYARDPGPAKLSGKSGFGPTLFQRGHQPRRLLADSLSRPAHGCREHSLDQLF